VILRHYRLAYWYKVSDFLRQQGHQVYIAKVPKIAPIYMRAAELLDFLVQHQLTGVHLIGHSMGGLDARYLIWFLSHYKQFMPTCQETPSASAWDKISILSCISLATPHFGSIMAPYFIDLLEGKRDWLGNQLVLQQSSPPPTFPAAAATSSASLSAPFSYWIKNNVWPNPANFLHYFMRSLIKPKDVQQDKLLSLRHPLFMTSSLPSYKDTDFSVEEKDIFIKRSLSHLSPDFIGHHFNPVILPKSGTCYYSSYGGDITALLPTDSDNTINYRRVLYPWRITYPVLLADELGKFPHKAPLGNDGLVSVRSSQFGSYKGTWNMLHPNFSRDWFMPISLSHPAQPSPPISHLYLDILQDLHLVESQSLSLQ
jgi:pimeloyl-ACP methyl ester carboxylesterase